jgi:hypothetical protein
VKKHKEKICIEFDIEYDEIEWKGNWIPKTVYKYREWENIDHQRILREHAIWVPDSLNFNDPFDCNIPIAYELIATDDQMAERFVRNLVPKRNRTLQEVEDEIQSKLKENLHKNLQFLEECKNDLLRSARKENGVFSVTPIKDNILMWSHYANSHRGFCIGFDSFKLFDFLGGGGSVRYEKQFPIISPVEERGVQHLLQVLTKSFHWAYEVEYRLTTFAIPNTAIEIPKECITEIIFGSRISEASREDMCKVLKENLPHVKCYTATPKKSEFSLEILPHVL